MVPGVHPDSVPMALQGVDELPLPPWKEHAVRGSRWGWVWGVVGLLRRALSGTTKTGMCCGQRGELCGALKWSGPRTALGWTRGIGGVRRDGAPIPITSEKPEIREPVGSQWSLGVNFPPPLWGT